MANSRPRKRNTRKTKIVTAGTTIHFEEPKSGRQPKPNVAAVVVQEINPVTGFLGFMRENAVVTVAVGFAIGSQAQVFIKQLISSFIDPAYALLFDGSKLSERTAILTFHGRSESFAWGAVVYTLLDFLFVILMIYLIVKFFQLDRLQKPKEEDKK